MKKNIFKKQIWVFVFGSMFLLACNSEKNSAKQETTKTNEVSEKSLENLSAERLEMLRNAAQESKNTNISDVFVKRGGELAVKYCKCGEQKDIQAQKSCRSRLEQTYKTIDSRLEKERKAAFTKAYNEGKKLCK